MVLGSFNFISEDAFQETLPAATRKLFHDANQAWALAIAVRCATACAHEVDIVEMAWMVFEHHIFSDALCVGDISKSIHSRAALYFSSDYSAVLQNARRLFRIALDKVVP